MSSSRFTPDSAPDSETAWRPAARCQQSKTRNFRGADLPYQCSLEPKHGGQHNYVPTSAPTSIAETRAQAEASRE